MLIDFKIEPRFHSGLSCLLLRALPLGPTVRREKCRTVMLLQFFDRLTPNQKLDDRRTRLF